MARSPTDVQRSTVPEVLRSAGKPLDCAVRADLEARLGADFSDVRTHDDGAAQRSVVEIGAHARTGPPACRRPCPRPSRRTPWVRVAPGAAPRFRARPPPSGPA
ncbi:DUF4157 domain-containing protein [Streptomyces sp. DSM 15324]|uniref:eCIS core domain-containing protein n=1 Tax=Streptomyces sp. DSM 15324 TaxID=1739111 RepID=UPI001F231C75|nr:DUF4157 domain-containing protein [Streptomyces sp. DSM 15324]